MLSSFFGRRYPEGGISGNGDQCKGFSDSSGGLSAIIISCGGVSVFKFSTPTNKKKVVVLVGARCIKYRVPTDAGSFRVPVNLRVLETYEYTHCHKHRHRLAVLCRITAHVCFPAWDDRSYSITGTLYVKQLALPPHNPDTSRCPCRMNGREKEA